MANAGGGAILFGVNDQRRVEGLDDPEQVEDELIDICRNQIKPAILPRHRLSHPRPAFRLRRSVSDRRSGSYRRRDRESEPARPV